MVMLIGRVYHVMTTRILTLNMTLILVITSICGVMKKVQVIFCADQLLESRPLHVHKEPVVEHVDVGQKGAQGNVRCQDNTIVVLPIHRGAIENFARIVRQENILREA